jgi:hypothetical protein
MSSLPLLLCVMLASTPDGGTPDAGPQELTRRLRFDVPHAIDEAEVPEMMRALGVPVRLRAVRSSDKPEVLMRHFAQAMNKAGLFIAPNTMELPGNMPHLTGLDVDNGVSYSVLLQSNLDGTTTVILGEAYLHARHEEPASNLAPLYPGAKGVLQASQESARTISYTVQALPSEVSAFYQKALAAEGLREEEPGIFSGPTRTVRVWIQSRPGGQSSVLLLIYPSTSPPPTPPE